MFERSVACPQRWGHQCCIGVLITFVIVMITGTPNDARSADASQPFTDTQALTLTAQSTLAAVSTPVATSETAGQGSQAGKTAANAQASNSATAQLVDATAQAAVPQGSLTPIDQLCIEGSVISFDESPSGDGWRISATRLNQSGQPLPNSQVVTVSDGSGTFRFDLGPRDFGAWLVVKEAKPGYEAITPDSFVVQVVYGRSQCVKVRFKQRPQIPVTVITVDEQNTPLPNWGIHAEPGTGNVFASPIDLTTGGDGRATFQLTPGLWILSERAPAGVAYTPVTPPNGRQELNVMPPGPFMLYFKNQLQTGNGCITARKLNVPPNQLPVPLPGWLVEVRRANGSVVASGRTFDNGIIRFSNLPPGSYRVVEESRAGWTPVTPVGFDAIVVSGDRCTPIEFYNMQQSPQFCIEGQAIDTNGKIGLPGWHIIFKPQDAGGFQPNPTITDGEGKFKVVLPAYNAHIRGAHYQVCEEMQPGWLAHSATCYTVTVPQQLGACAGVPAFENQQIGHGDSQMEHGDNQTAPVAGCRLIHIVKRGEGLIRIGQQYGVSLQAMLKANPWVRQRRHSLLRIGDKVCIP